MIDSPAPEPANPPPLEGMFPGYFALVMATGIVSIASLFAGFPRLARTLFWLNVFFYAALWILTLARFVLYRRSVVADLTSHARSVLFLTMVAATEVLGSQVAQLTDWHDVAKGLWFLGIVLWVLLISVFFAVTTLKEPKPPLERGINGAWLLVVVSTESLAVLGAFVAPTLSRPEPAFFLALCAYFVGAMLYILFIALILYRWMFFAWTLDALTPSYWINMGALAITTLAGSRLLLARPQWPFLEEIAPFLKGFTLFFWAAGAWWIPLLVIAGVWKHGVERVPLTYHPQYWSLVFPLGMFTACTFALAKALGLDFLVAIPRVFFWFALAAWVVTFVGMIRDLARKVRPQPAARLAAAVLLAFVAASARGDGGRIRLRQTSGPFALTVFTAPEPLAVGLADLSVLVQDAATGAVVLDADVEVRVRAPRGDAFVERRTSRGGNRLLRAASIDFDAPGRWDYAVVVRTAAAHAEVGGSLDVAPAVARWRSAWPFLAVPPIAVALFLAGARRRRTSPPSP